jgi:hypothetical protein
LAAPATWLHWHIGCAGNLDVPATWLRRQLGCANNFAVPAKLSSFIVLFCWCGINNLKKVTKKYCIFVSAKFQDFELKQLGMVVPVTRQRQ